MLTGEMTLEIRILHRQGKSIRAIARELGISRETVRKYLRAPDLASIYGPRAPRPSKLDPFKGYLKMRIAEAAPRRLPATVYLRELRELGYAGGITILKDWLAQQYLIRRRGFHFLKKSPSWLCKESAEIMRHIAEEIEAGDASGIAAEVRALMHDELCNERRC